MKQRFFHRYKGDDMLKFLSLLSVNENNSLFTIRIFYAQMAAYGMWRRGKYDWGKIENVLTNGIPSLEDPQESLFVETVNTPIGSFRVFSSIFLTHKHLLSQLLYLANKVELPVTKLSLVYALLEISDIIADRFSYGRNVLGNPQAEEVTYGSYASFNSSRDYTTFSALELSGVLRQFGLTEDNILPLLLDVRGKEIEKDCMYDGNSDIFELHPFIRLKSGGFLVSIPSFLLRTAYVFCFQILKNELGEKLFLELVEVEMIQETVAILTTSMSQFLQEKVYEGMPFLWFRFDNNKIANVAICLSDKHADVEKAIAASTVQINKSYPDSTIFTLLVVQQLDERDGILTISKPVTHFSVEELKIVLSQDRINLLNLFYYNQDKASLNFPPICQEIDKFAYYYDKGCTFYQDQKPTFLVIEIGYALSMRAKYLVRMDEHVVKYEPSQSSVLVRHLADIPNGVPIYAPYMKIKHVYMLQLKDFELWIHIGDSNEFLPFMREFVISCFNWFYASELKKGLTPINRNVYVEISMIPGGQFKHIKLNENTMIFSVPSEILDGNADDLEYTLISEFILALKNCGVLSTQFGEDILKVMMAEAGTGFIQICKDSNMNIIDVNDGVTSCHYVNKRHCDVILSEIADFLNIKGNEKSFSNDESKNIMIRVSEYLLSEVQKIINMIDTSKILKSLIELHHAMIYWSKLTQRRYDGLSRAYAYIDAVFENQFEYVNDYSEMNTLTQGLIEALILNDVHNSGGELDVETIDRLFALMHEILHIGVYMDQLSAKISGSELTILANGRIVMPKPLIDKQNQYFYRLREFAMTRPDLFSQYSKLIPEATLDPESEQFKTAFVAEYEISFDQYYKMINASIDYATMKKSPIMVISEQEFYDIVAKDILDEEEVRLFKKHFVLESLIKDEGLKHSDKWLQRFNRPIQITVRPWILFEGNIYYSTKTIYESFMVKIERLSNGSINVSENNDAMKQFVAQINNDKGHIFTKGVTEFYSNLGIPDMVVLTEVPITPDKPLKSQKNLGDIDILLINKTTKQIICIEAKNYVESRTAYELIQQNRKIETKELKHVIERDVWCKGNINMFRYYEASVDDEYTVKTVFLTYHENAYKYFEHDINPDIVFLSAMDVVQNPMVVFEN